MARIPTPSEVDLSKYDVIIIGSGPAGCSLADRLSARLRSCLIIETGIEVYDEHIQSAYTSMQTQGHFGDQHWARHWIRAFGGTSAVWTAVSTVFDRH